MTSNTQNTGTQNTGTQNTGTDELTRVAIVGCGIIGRHHGIVLTRHPAFRVTALVDPDPEAIGRVLAAIAEGGGETPTVSASIAEACDRDDVDLAVISTPSGMHTEQATEALDHGVHVVIEKPLDVGVDRGRRFAERPVRPRRTANWCR